MSPQLYDVKWEKRGNKQVLCVSQAECSGDRRDQFLSDLAKLTGGASVNLYSLIEEQINSSVPEEPAAVRRQTIADFMQGCGKHATDLLRRLQTGDIQLAKTTQDELIEHFKALKESGMEDEIALGLVEK